MKLHFFLPVSILLTNLTPCSKTSLPIYEHNVSAIIAHKKGLTLKEANNYITEIDNQEKEKDKATLKSLWDNKEFSYKGKKLKFKTNTYGEKPADGRSLYISLHGGGGTTAAANDGQWNNQVAMTSDKPNMYNIKEGVVVVPRAPTDSWNMWFQDEVYVLLAQTIRAATLFADINPDKVYVMGYSAGGDGIFRLATYMADYWAAAAMSAGHPGETTPLNLRNIGFALNMGGKDDAYKRNELAAEWKQKLNKLASEDPAGYKHMVSIFADKPHWMKMEDKIAIPFISGFKRQPYANTIVWEQNSSHVQSFFYWLGISETDAKTIKTAENSPKTIQVSFDGNTINIKDNFASELYLYLNDKMLDLDKTVIVKYKGNQIFKGKVKRSKNVIAQTAAERKDSAYIFSAKLTVAHNQKIIISD